MDHESVQQVAQAVAQQMFLAPWQQVLVYLGVLLLGGVLGSLGGSYFGERGKNLATKADFADLQDHLHATTQLVEGIKHDIGHKGWERREWATARRQKLEEMLDSLYAADEELDRIRNASIEGTSSTGGAHLSRADTLAALYFPEIRTLVQEYTQKQRSRWRSCLALGLAVATAKGIQDPVEQEAAKKAARDDFLKAYRAQYAESLKTFSALEKASADLVRKISGVE